MDGKGCLRTPGLGDENDHHGVPESAGKNVLLSLEKNMVLFFGVSKSVTLITACAFNEYFFRLD